MRRPYVARQLSRDNATLQEFCGTSAPKPVNKGQIAQHSHCSSHPPAPTPCRLLTTLVKIVRPPGINKTKRQQQIKRDQTMKPPAQSCNSPGVLNRLLLQPTCPTATTPPQPFLRRSFHASGKAPRQDKRFDQIRRQCPATSCHVVSHELRAHG